MQKVLGFLFSMKLTIFLLVLFAILIGAATFIENEYDTTTAKVVIFNSKLLEIIMVLLVINFLGNLKKYAMLSWKKLPAFVFHFGFIVTIVGAAVSRYTGYEGMMLIREGATTNIMYSSEPILDVSIIDLNSNYGNGGIKQQYAEPYLISQLGGNEFDLDFQLPDKSPLTVSYDTIINNAKKFFENAPKGEGTDYLVIQVPKGRERDTVYIEKGKAERVGELAVSFNNPDYSEAIQINHFGDSFSVLSPIPMLQFNMPAGITPEQRRNMSLNDIAKDTIKPNVLSPLKFGQMHMTGSNNFRVIDLLENKKEVYRSVVSNGMEDNLKNVLVINLDYKGKNKKLNIVGGKGVVTKYEYGRIGDLNYKIGYGSNPIQLPFSLRLNDFILDRYAGSDSPSSFKSKVTLIDEEAQLAENHDIYMNHVLDYKGYRFFQSSYDSDEKGTRLSVNHDTPGTWITYIGYFLLGLGFFLTFINRNSRFIGLFSKIKDLRKRRLELSIGLMLLSMGLMAQSEYKPVNKEQADKFATLITQNYSKKGRFMPVNTTAINLVRKITKKNSITTSGGVKLTPNQWLLDVILNKPYWAQQPIFKITEDTIKKILGIDTNYISYRDFHSFETKRGLYKLKPYLEVISRKPDNERNRLDKELIKLNDKYQTFYYASRGELLRIFPTNNKNTNNRWIHLYEKGAEQPIPALDSILTGGSKISYLMLLVNYFNSINPYNPDYESADQYLTILSGLQRKLAPKGILPSESRINMELTYNNQDFFKKAERLYSILAVFLLLFAFLEILSKNKNTKSFKLFIKFPLYFLIGLLAIGFLLHTGGLIMRTYITQHAPWSDGFEALVFISWCVVLAGFCFARFSKITLAAASLLAFLVLMTAGHSTYDPQMTELEPVLVSYWLNIHVAVITCSYGFFGLGFILSLINIGTWLFNTKKNKTLDYLTSELTLINELTLSVGVALAAVGTFLGGVWANESWGRYWGWDAKETWALVIVLFYGMVLHLRFIPGLRSKFSFNVASILGFTTVLMTFFGVNYYFSNSVHSYARGDAPAFPIWIWLTGLALTLIILIAYRNFKKLSNQ